MEASSVSRLKYLIISLFLLSLIAWIVEGLIAAETLTFSAYSTSEVLNLLAGSLKYLVFLAFFAIAAGALTVMILDRRLLIESLKGLISQPKDISNQSMLRRLVTLAVGLSITFVCTWFLVGGGMRNLGFPQLGGGQPSGGSASQPSLPSDASGFEPLMPTLLWLSGVIFIAAVFVGCLLFIQAIKEVREEARAVPLPEKEVLQEEALNVVRKAISEIKAREDDLDFRAAIIKCYQGLCELLARRNCQIQKHETVQEFRISASKLLNIPDKPFSTLTNLFEEARYSIHEIDETKRNEALECLEEIRNYLIGGKQ